MPPEAGDGGVIASFIGILMGLPFMFLPWLLLHSGFRSFGTNPRDFFGFVVICVLGFGVDFGVDVEDLLLLIETLSSDVVMLSMSSVAVSFFGIWETEGVAFEV